MVISPLDLSVLIAVQFIDESKGRMAETQEKSSVEMVKLS